MKEIELKQFLEDLKSFIIDNKEHFTVMSAASDEKYLIKLKNNMKGKTEFKTEAVNKAEIGSGVSNADRLKFLRDEKVNECIKCRLSIARKKIVFGEGSPESRLMFIGEAPGAEEDNTGRPFVGRAGQLLTKIIESIGLKREEVYIANIIKCRPPENRNPLEDEINLCVPFLKEQISIIKPEIICTLGKFATEFIIGKDKGAISSVRGKEFNYEGINVIPTYHPSYLLRNPGAKRETWEDMKKIRGLYFKN
ncbi:MAG: uracil-DNA glycosylase [Deltaproteobacteria bacterium]|nr:uracil-DNA glycosylase [Deltaproteobacteria bacterium]